MDETTGDLPGMAGKGLSENSASIMAKERASIPSGVQAGSRHGPVCRFSLEACEADLPETGASGGTAPPAGKESGYVLSVFRLGRYAELGIPS